MLLVRKILVMLLLSCPIGRIRDHMNLTIIYFGLTIVE